MAEGLNALDIFVNCPFDPSYRPIFNAIVFTIVRSGYQARCALETDDGADNRLAKICAIIEECKFGIHDISRTETDGEPPLPRFNMPLELGLFLGAKRYGRKIKRRKCASSLIANSTATNATFPTLPGRTSMLTAVTPAES